MWALARVRPGYAAVPCCTQKYPEPAAAPSPTSDLTGKCLVRQPRLAMIYGGWWPRHPIDTALSNSCSLAVLQALRLALPLLGSAHTYFEHFDIFIGTVGKMIYGSPPFQPFYGDMLLKRLEEGSRSCPCLLSLQGSGRALCSPLLLEVNSGTPGSVNGSAEANLKTHSSTAICVCLLCLHSSACPS